MFTNADPMSYRALLPHLQPQSREPLSLQLVRLFVKAIQAGKLQPGERLPGTRELAKELDVTRHVVMAAFQELQNEGWLESRPASGHFVATRLPASPAGAPRPGPARPSDRPSHPGFDLGAHLQHLTEETDLLLDLREGLPDPRQAPKEALAQAYRRALRLHGDRLLGAGEPEGNRTLREALAQWLRQARGLDITPDHVLITRGVRWTLASVLPGLLGEGGTIGVVVPAPPGIAEILSGLQGLRIVPVPLSPSGDGLEGLDALIRSERIRLLYLQPCHAYPTGATLPNKMRGRLIELARHHRLALLEDDGQSVFTFEGANPLPMAAGEHFGLVLHMGSFSQLVAPGLHLGYVVAPRDLVRRLARLGHRQGGQGDRVLEWAMADLIRDGDLDRHLLRTTRLYRERRDHVAALLRERMGHSLSFESPKGGLGFWLEPAGNLLLDPWIARCRDRGLVLHPPARFLSGHGAAPRTFLAFSPLDGPRAAQAAAIMEQAAGP